MFNPKIAIGRLRNNITKEVKKFDEVRSGYEWEETATVRTKSHKYKIYVKSDEHTVPDEEGLVTIRPPIWKGRLNEIDLEFYSTDENDERYKDMSKAAVQLHKKWGEGLYHVLRYPCPGHPRIENLFEPAFVRRID